MTATKVDSKKLTGKKYNPSARPPQRLSKEDKALLKSLTPNKELMDYVASLPKLKIVDGSTCGL
jgi:hypothetical protein